MLVLCVESACSRSGELGRTERTKDSLQKLRYSCARKSESEKERERETDSEGGCTERERERLTDRQRDRRADRQSLEGQCLSPCARARSGFRLDPRLIPVTLSSEEFEMKMNDVFTVAEETAYLYMLPGCN